MTVKFLAIPFFALSLALVSCGGNTEEQKIKNQLMDWIQCLQLQTLLLVAEDNEIKSYNFTNLPYKLRMCLKNQALVLFNIIK